ncbi:unnamed protein product [Sphenostylis stenocarpa]|uniref:Uncharacterized protein n=1 Tax=Sphenostylis stenocarpa TaxID=92480 RepID=A0AA86VYG5_9FABA|nr:unnamed protein product [Sphenostylis stenocarpa]
MEPPLPPDSFGNYYRITMTTPSLNTGQECHDLDLVKQIRDQIKKIDIDYVRKLQDGNEHFNFLKDISYRVLEKGELVSFNITSLCRFPLYDADFGWGKPTWRHRGYVSLKVEDMTEFEADEDLLALVNTARAC